MTQNKHTVKCPAAAKRAAELLNEIKQLCKWIPASLEDKGYSDPQKIDFSHVGSLAHYHELLQHIFQSIGPDAIRKPASKQTLREQIRETLLDVTRGMNLKVGTPIACDYGMFEVISVAPTLSIMHTSDEEGEPFTNGPVYHF